MAGPAKKAGHKASEPSTSPTLAPAPTTARPMPPPGDWVAVHDHAPLTVPVPPTGGRESFWGGDGVPRMLRWSPARFFQAPPPVEGVPASVRFAAAPLRLAGVFALLGFFAVFVDQASLELQIVIGAPVFEEMVKFGLALLLVGAIPRVRGPVFFLVAFVRVAVGWAVGAGFGWLEHTLTYSEEAREILVGRILFHAGSTALSMAMFCVLEGAADVRLRWFSTAPATLLHYANNVGAVALIAAPDVGLWWAGGITAAVYAALLVLPAASRWWRPPVEAWARGHWPVRVPPVPEDWASARAQEAAQASPVGPAAPGPSTAPEAPGPSPRSPGWP